MSGPLWDAHIHCLENQEGVEVSFKHYRDDGTGGYAVEGTHRWQEEGIERVSILRQRFFNHALKRTHEWDYFMMVDTDLLLAPDTLKRMLAERERFDAHVAYGVFWTQWSPGGKPQPQVWDTQPYGISDHLYRRLQNRETMIVHGGGACTLFNWSAIDECRYHPRIPSLPKDGSMWRGEDRTFALCCEVNQLTQIAVGDVKIAHMYSEAQRTEAAILKGLEMVRQA